MPTMSLGGVIASILQFMVIFTILMPALVYHTSTGNSATTANFSTNANEILLGLNGTFLAQNGTYSLQQQMSEELHASAGNNIAAGVLQTLGGLAFIPAALGSYMNTIFVLPGTIWTLFTHLLSSTGNTVLPFSLTLISGAFLAYCVIIFVMKAFTPISKVSMEDV